MTRRTPKASAQKSAARYDAAGMGRRAKSWNPPSTGPVRAVQGLQKLRDRARDSARNDWAGASIIQKWATNLVGVGITPRWEAAKFAEVWNKLVPTADADGVLDAYGLQTLGVRCVVGDGEVFMRRRPRSLDAPLDVPVQFQLIESEFCPAFDALTWEGMPIGNRIIQGIEVNKFGRRVAYWLFKEHPGDGQLASSSLSAERMVRVLASDIRHIFQPLRPGQMRGASWLAPVLMRLRASADFEDAVLDRQKLANLFVAFITRAMPDNADIDFDPVTGLPKWYNAEGTPIAGLEPGMMQELQPGESVTFANPPEAGTSFPDYQRSNALGTAAGAGMPYEIMSGDIQNVSDRTLRVILNEFRRLARQIQWQVLIPMMCQPMVVWGMDAAALAGLVSLRDLDASKACKWNPEGWEYIHPVQDVQGKKLQIEAGLTSRTRAVAERGDDVREIDQERADDLKREKQLGSVPPPPPSPAPAKPTPNALEAAQVRALDAQTQMVLRPVAPVASEPSEMERTLAALTERMQASQSEFAAVATALAGITQALASREVNVSVQPAAVTVTNEVQPAGVTVQPAAVNITNEVNPTPVNVQAPTVNVTNEVQPATVDVNLPVRQTTSEILRDAEGNIKRVTQTEKTIEE